MLCDSPVARGQQATVGERVVLDDLANFGQTSHGFRSVAFALVTRRNHTTPRRSTSRRICRRLRPSRRVRACWCVYFLFMLSSYLLSIFQSFSVGVELFYDHWGIASLSPEFNRVDTHGPELWAQPRQPAPTRTSNCEHLPRQTTDFLDCAYGHTLHCFTKAR